ncbi:Protein kinase, putative [Hondaea fermentalgiana]|uniref:Protein kinase, putative n=1 Tax=Hondaea fermentalgiana TaxID=2315210 RepID=A0A2R5GIY0_9STRA|nr:Protein kinase, putative [Hondaea fermentalgiana]|eukprot:GBG30565.1 Protein kinase, putative [Hondaea fermentalgiana]
MARALESAAPVIAAIEIGISIAIEGVGTINVETTGIEDGSMTAIGVEIESAVAAAAVAAAAHAYPVVIETETETETGTETETETETGTGTPRGAVRMDRMMRERANETEIAVREEGIAATEEVAVMGTATATATATVTVTETVIVLASGSHGDESSYDDEVGAYYGKYKDVIRDRYVIRKELGRGTFGSVYSCIDKTHPNAPPVAVKVVRCIRRYVLEAMEEAAILRKITGVSENLRIAKWLNNFEWKEHYCIVSEELSMSLHDFQKAIDFKPMRLEHVTIIMKDLFEALMYLHEASIVHTDLKVENIMLERRPPDIHDYGKSSSPLADQTNFRVKLIDFGGATRIRSSRPYSMGIISTRQYRAPEVLLDLPWSTPADIWSAGCILMELLCGKLLFETHEEHEHLALIERVVGGFPSRMAAATPELFTSRGYARFPISSTPSDRVEFVRRARPLKDLVRQYAPRVSQESNEQSLAWFTSVVSDCLKINPMSRATATELSRRRVVDESS